MTEIDILSGDKLFEVLNKQNWEKMLPSLYAYSIGVLKYKYRIKEDSKKLLGNEAVDFTHEAIKSLWEGRRKWNISVYPDLYNFLAGAIDSIIYNFVKANLSNRKFIDDDILKTSDILHEEGIDKKIILQEIHLMVRNELKGDEEAEKVFDCMVDGMMLPREICLELGFDDNKVYNIIKRVRRKKEKIISIYLK